MSEVFYIILVSAVVILVSEQRGSRRIGDSGIQLGFGYIAQVVLGA